jgi:hypothetical protein
LEERYDDHTTTTQLNHFVVEFRLGNLTI